MAFPPEDTTRRSRDHIVGPGWTGTIHRRVVNVGKAGMATLLDSGSLALGHVMPTKYGGPGGAGVASPRLQYARAEQQTKGRGQDQVLLTYIEIDAGAESNGYAEATRTRSQDKDAHSTVFHICGIALTAASTGIPALGDFLDGDGTSKLNPKCGPPYRIDEEQHEGRVFVYSTWTGLNPVTPIS